MTQLIACLILTLLNLSLALDQGKSSYGYNDISELVHRLEEMESYVHSQSKKIKDLETTVLEQKLQIQRIGDMNGYDESLKQKSREQEQVSLLTKGRRATPRHVAFSAYLDHRMSNVGINQIIKFDKTILNEGNAYNNVTGIFTCPVSGVYLFSYMVNTWVDAYQLVVKLVLDGVNESDGTSDPFHNLQEVQGGNTVLMRVNKGQSVWLAAYNTGNTIVDGREDYRFSTLSGVLLYE